jgi:hypothetical protein
MNKNDLGKMPVTQDSLPAQFPLPLGKQRGQVLHQFRPVFRPQPADGCLDFLK